MSYYIRLLTPEETAPSAGEISDALRAEGFEVTVDAAPAQASWETLTVSLPGQDPIQANRWPRRGEENPADEELDELFDLLLEEEESPQSDRVEDALRHTRQLIALEVPDTFPWGGGRTVVDALVEFLADATEALIQADGEGFYDRNGELLLALE